MASGFEITEAFLHQLQDHYERQKLPSHWSESSEELPSPTLMLCFDEIGSRDAVIDLELSFIPGIEAFSKAGVYILQTFATLKEDMMPSTDTGLLAKIAEINLNLPLGSFGLIAGKGALYFKHNTLLNREWLTSSGALEHIDRQNALILYQLTLYIDALLDAAEGE